MKDWKTTLGQIMTAIGLVPSGLDYINIAELPDWLKTVGIGCAFVSFIWTGLQTKDKG